MNKLIFKRIDFWLQTTLIFIFFISTLNYFLFSNLDNISFASFFVIGFWQVFSAIINFFWLKIDSKSRKFWQIVSFLLIFLIIIAFFCLNILFFFEVTYFLFYFLYFALFTSPILAIWYLIITWTELAEMEKTELKK